MNSDQHSNPAGIVAADNHDKAIPSNATDLLSSFRSLTNNSASNCEFVKNVIAQEQRTQALLGIEFSPSNSLTVEPLQTNNQLFNSAYPGNTLVRHEIIQRPLNIPSRNAFFGRTYPNHNINNLHALQPTLRNLSMNDITLQALTSQVNVPMYREDSDVTAGSKSIDTSISQYLRNHLTDRQRLNDAHSVSRSSSLLPTTLAVMGQKPRGNDTSISQYLRNCSTDRRRIIRNTSITNVLNSQVALNSSVTEQMSHGNSHKVPPLQCHDIVAHFPSKPTKGRPTAFPQTLYQLLSDLEMQAGGSAIASFLPHGRGIAIHKPEEFTMNVMPEYFDMRSFSSFRRQLKLYNFQQIRKGPDKGSYYHEHFVRGRPQLLAGIKRSNNKR